MLYKNLLLNGNRNEPEFFGKEWRRTMKRVVITGIGVVSPLGNDIKTFWENVKKGKHGINKITKFDASDFPIKVAAEVKDFDPLLCMNKKETRRRDLYCQYALEATRQAIMDSASDFKNDNPYRLGVFVGSGIVGMHTFEEEYGHYLARGSRSVSPFTIPKLISNMASGEIAIQYGFKGKNFNITSACATSTNTLGAAGAIEAIICSMALKEGFVPMTVGYKEYDEDCDLNYVTEKGIEKDITYALSNSLGFGGHNSALCLKKYAG